MSPPKIHTSMLRSLHRIHRQLADLNERLQRGPKHIEAGQAHVAHQQEQLADVQAKAKALRIATDAKQLQQQAGEGKINDLHGKLMSAASNREYQALKDQIDAQKMANSVLDDEILEGWEKLDLLRKEIGRAEDDLVAARQKAEQINNEVQQQEPLIREDLERLGSELKQCEALLPTDILEVYRRVVRQRGEDALAAVENQFCSGCHRHVPLNVISEILLNKPMFCKACGRLLYVPEDGSPGQ